MNKINIIKFFERLKTKWVAHEPWNIKMEKSRMYPALPGFTRKESIVPSSTKIHEKRVECTQLYQDSREKSQMYPALPGFTRKESNVPSSTGIHEKRVECTQLYRDSREKSRMYPALPGFTRKSEIKKLTFLEVSIVWWKFSQHIFFRNIFCSSVHRVLSESGFKNNHPWSTTTGGNIG